MHEPPVAPCTIIAFGNSITQAGEVEPKHRWLSLLDARLQQFMAGRSMHAINAGVGGNTSREGLARMEESVLAYHPDLVLVEFGGNDATKEPERHVTIEEFRANLETMRRAIVEEAGATMMLLTFPPVVDAWHQWGQDAYYQRAGGLDAYVEAYRQCTRAYAQSAGITLIDIDQALREAAGRDGWERYLRPDGVHLTVEGNAVVADAIYPAVAEWLRARTAQGR